MVKRAAPPAKKKHAAKKLGLGLQEQRIQEHAFICEQLGCCSKSLKKIIDAGMNGAPMLITVNSFHYLNLCNEDLANIYAKAKSQQMEFMADEIIEIADDGKNDTYIDPDGLTKTNTDVIQRSRLRVDTRKWLMAKLKPRKYGDGLALLGGGGENGTPEEIAERIQAALVLATKATIG